MTLNKTKKQKNDHICIYIPLDDSHPEVVSPRHTNAPAKSECVASLGAFHFSGTKLVRRGTTWGVKGHRNTIGIKTKPNKQPICIYHNFMHHNMYMIYSIYNIYIYNVVY